MDGIEVAGLSVRRGKRTAPLVLQGLSCSMAAAGITGLMGPSGSGKTTLLRAIVGVQQLAGGSITVFGSPAGSAVLRARIGYMTQAASVYADLSVQENIRYFATLGGAADGAVASAIGEVGLAGFEKRVVHTLSGGQRSRVSLACAIVGNPDLLILDEPTVGLDPVLREEIWDFLRRRAAAGATIVVSSHVMDEAMRCDRLLLLRGGRLLADATPAEVLADAGATDMDTAFLTLIRRTEAVA